MRWRCFACILVAVKAKKADAGRAKIEKELREALAELDEQGLLYLLRQAQVLIHNARVDRLNAEATRAEEKPPSRSNAARRSQDPAPTVVTIEQPEPGKPIILTLGRTRKILSPEEMKRLVRICYGAETRSEALRQLFTVMAKERKDILADALIGNPDNPLLVALFNAIRNTYRLEERM
jgi:hypothetical protein